MHRTQLLFEDDQYLDLRRQAAREGRSMGDLVREIVAAGLAARRQRSGAGGGLGELRGLIEDADGVARAHDEALYGQG